MNLARGYPRFNPGEYTAVGRVGACEADAALIVASDPMANFSQSAREHLKRFLTSPWTPRKPDHAACGGGLHGGHLRHQRPGTVYRMDDVPIPLRPAFESPHPSDAVILKGIEKRIREIKGLRSWLKQSLSGD